jgi:hypothetical protein
MLDRLCQLIEEVVYPAPRLLVAQTIQVCMRTLTVDDRLAATIPGVRPRSICFSSFAPFCAFDAHRISSRTSPAPSETPPLWRTISTFAAGIPHGGRLTEQISVGALLHLTRQTDPSRTGDPAKLF